MTFEKVRVNSTNLVAMSKKKIFSFADDGPGYTVGIRNIIMSNRDVAEAHIAPGGAVE